MKSNFGKPRKVHVDLLMLAIMKGIPMLPAAAPGPEATPTSSWLCEHVGIEFEAIADAEVVKGTSGIRQARTQIATKYLRIIGY